MIRLFVDGSALNNGQHADKEKPCYGGWAYLVLNDNDPIDSSSGYEINSSNQRMELKAALEVLKFIKEKDWLNEPEPRSIRLISDSTYLIDGINKCWFKNWLSSNWYREGKLIKNKDLWEQLVQVLEELGEIHILKAGSLRLVEHHYRIDYTFMKGHIGNVYHDFCDQLAKKRARELSRGRKYCY